MVASQRPRPGPPCSLSAMSAALSISISTSRCLRAARDERDGKVALLSELHSVGDAVKDVWEGNEPSPIRFALKRRRRFPARNKESDAPQQ